MPTPRPEVVYIRARRFIHLHVQPKRTCWLGAAHVIMTNGEAFKVQLLLAMKMTKAPYNPLRHSKEGGGGGGVGGGGGGSGGGGVSWLIAQLSG